MSIQSEETERNGTKQKKETELEELKSNWKWRIGNWGHNEKAYRVKYIDW